MYPAAFPKQERINIHGLDPVTCDVLTIYGGDSQLITQSRLDHPLGSLFRTPIPAVYQRCDRIHGPMYIRHEIFNFGSIRLEF